MVGVHFYPCRAIARSWDGKRIYVGHSHACFRRWRDRCLSTVSVPLLLLSLTAPPTASSYIIPSPFFRAAACIYWLISLFFNLCIFTPLTPAACPIPWLIIRNSAIFIPVKKCKKCRHSYIQAMNAGLDTLFCRVFMLVYIHTTERESRDPSKG